MPPTAAYKTDRKQPKKSHMMTFSSFQKNSKKQYTCQYQVQRIVNNKLQMLVNTLDLTNAEKIR